MKRVLEQFTHKKCFLRKKLHSFLCFMFSVKHKQGVSNTQATDPTPAAIMQGCIHLCKFLSVPECTPFAFLCLSVFCCGCTVYTSIHIMQVNEQTKAHQYTSVNTHQCTSVNISTHQYTWEHISAHQHNIVHINIHINTNINTFVHSVTHRFRVAHLYIVHISADSSIHRSMHTILYTLFLCFFKEKHDLKKIGSPRVLGAAAPRPPLWGLLPPDPH